MAEPEQERESLMDAIADKIHGNDSPPEPVVESAADTVTERSHDHDESLLDKITEKIHSHGSSSSSSDSDNDSPSKADAVKAKMFRLFGREKPVHKVLGGGKPADIFLWRNKKISAIVVSCATLIWILFELVGYHLITLVCHAAIFGLAVLFLWSNVSTFINRSPPEIPDVALPEEYLLQMAAALRYEINKALTTLHDIASGKDVKKFLTVIAGMWILSIIGNWFNFLTLFYISFVLLHTVPVVYEKHEDKVDSLSEKAWIKLKNQYSVIEANVLSRIPKAPLKGKKMN